jgi:hypothetical protein
VSATNPTSVVRVRRGVLAHSASAHRRDRSGSIWALLAGDTFGGAPRGQEVSRRHRRGRIIRADARESG